MTLDDELNTTLLSFTDLQAELNLRHAQDALRDIVDHLDLTPTEREGLEPDIGGLQRMMDKLDRTCVQIAVFGMVGRGKSSVLNALLGQEVFISGPIHGVTQTTQIQPWEMTDNQISNIPTVSYRICQIELIDTPGIDEVDGETREKIARQVAQQVDLLLFVIAGDITQVEYDALSQLREAGKPMLLVFNKIDQYPEADRQAIYEKIRDERVKELLSPDEIVMAAASPLIAKAIRRPDGTLSAEITRGEPKIEELKLKILEILDREGKSLVALNTMLYAGDINEKLVRRKMEIREASANRVIWNGVMTKSIAIALNPMMMIDLFSGAVIDVALILTLSKLYGISMTQQGAVELLQKIALSMGGITASELVANFGLSSLKSILGLTATATGGLSLIPYLSVAIPQAAIAGVSGYAIGQVTKAYLANGASWGEEGPKAVVQNILETLDETSIMNRIKQELWKKINLQKKIKEI